MEISVKQTQCPFCQSVFYITTLQLQAYHGHARCGQCQQVFDAAAHLIEPSPASTHDLSATSSAHLGDVFDRQFLDEQLALPTHPAQSQTLQEAQKQAEAERQEANELVEKILAVQPHASQHALINDNTHQQNNSNVISEHDETLLSYLKQSGVATAQTPNIHRNAVKEKPAQHRILQSTRVRKNHAGTLGWSILCLLMLALLAAQYVYFNFERLTYNSKTRPYMNSMCQLIGCSLPYMNAAEIQLYNVTLVASAQNQTTFTAWLMNQATWSQPFPALKLSLLRQGQVVASEAIQPRQYLPQQSKTLSRLPTRTPYQVTFTINRAKSNIEQFSLSPEFK